MLEISNTDKQHYISFPKLPDIGSTTLPPIPTNVSLGEPCGSCFCPPLFTMGECADGLECVHNNQLVDLPGTCVEPGIHEKVCFIETLTT